MNRHWVNENELQITCHLHMGRALAGPLIRCYSILKRLMFRTMYSVGVWVCVCVCLGGIGEREAHTLDVHRSNSSLHSNCMWKKCQFFFVFLVNIVRVHRKISTYDDDDKRKQRHVESPHVAVRMAWCRLNQRVNETKICEIVKCRTQEMYLNLHICCRCWFFFFVFVFCFVIFVQYFFFFVLHSCHSFGARQKMVFCVCVCDCLSCIWNRINIHSHLDGCRVVFSLDGIGARHDRLSPIIRKGISYLMHFHFFTRRKIVGNESLTEHKWIEWKIL